MLENLLNSFDPPAFFTTAPLWTVFTLPGAAMGIFTVISALVIMCLVYPYKDSDPDYEFRGVLACAIAGVGGGLVFVADIIALVMFWDGALHPALTGRNADTDISVDLNPSYEMEFTIRVGAGTMARLVQILNAAPVDGDPLNVTVNLEIDSTASDRAREKIARYLADNGYEATLENIAAGYVYNVDSLNELQVDAAGREYVVSRITTLTGTFKQENITTPTIYETRFIVSAPSGALMFCADGKRMGEFEGEEYGGYRIVKVFVPGGCATNGGVILERIEGGDD